MEIQPDFKELLALFNEHKVEYLIVGGYALAFHGAPRYTGDIDLLVRPDAANAQRVLDALDAFGFKFPNLSLGDFTKPASVVQLGVPPVRIDIITGLSGVTWEDAAASEVSGTYGDIPVFYIGVHQYIINKRASGRLKDLADIDAIEARKGE